jgi:hypothetical protein
MKTKQETPKAFGKLLREAIDAKAAARSGDPVAIQKWEESRDLAADVGGDGNRGDD